YTAQGFDQFGNSLGDVTASTGFSIAPNGSCTAASCTATGAGSHTVTGTNSGKTAKASLNVTAGAAASGPSGPASGTLAAGGSQPYTAQGFDQYGNTLGDVTGATMFSITDGSCSGANCTANLAGPHTVTGNDSGKTAQALLNVTAGAPAQLAFGVQPTDTPAG